MVTMFVHCLPATTVQRQGQRAVGEPVGPQNLKYLLCGPSQKMLTDTSMNVASEKAERRKTCRFAGIVKPPYSGSETEMMASAKDPLSAGANQRRVEHTQVGGFFRLPA